MNREPPPDCGPLDTIGFSYGHETVGRNERRARIGEMFDAIAGRYDLMNDLMSFWLHRVWKRRAAGYAAGLPGSGPATVIDLAGGTGDLAARVRAALPHAQITICDPSPGMLTEAGKRGLAGVRLVEGTGEAMPFEDNSADLVTLAFGLRNMSDPAGALAEVARVLGPKGTLVLLEFSRPDWFFAPFYALHARFVIPLLGTLVAGRRSAYRYLTESISRFPGPEVVARALGEAGFEMVRIEKLMFGVAAIHVARVV